MVPNASNETEARRSPYMTTLGSAKTTGLVLKSIRPTRISHGGYSVSCDGTLPSGAQLWLGMPDLSNAMEVTGKPHASLIDPSNLAAFLALIGKQRTLWGTKGRCQLFIKKGPTLLGVSNALEFACPVRPYVGKLQPSLGEGDTGPELKYTGTPPHYPDGRVLHVPAIDGCYYFSHGDQFETDNQKRGFNCITYVGAVFGVDAKSKAMSSYGTQLANHCGCTAVGCENQPIEAVRAFFVQHPKGTYLMWSAHHIVIVLNATVHEFREKLGGYNTQPIASWGHHDKRWWVRKAIKQF
jgi:hypothetical protein